MVSRTTGFPIVDACMRQLNTTGYMHNRGRMIVALFLTKDLFIDWRWGEKYFATQLTDYNISANNGAGNGQRVLELMLNLILESLIPGHKLINSIPNANIYRNGFRN